MADSMMERVAIALYALEMDWPDAVSLEQAQACLTCSDALGDHSGDCTKEAHTCMRCERDRMMAKARAAVESMRQPTEVMFVRGDEQIIAVLNGHTFALKEPTVAVRCWHAMIDAALAEDGATLDQL